MSIETLHQADDQTMSDRNNYWQQFLHLGLIWTDWSRLLLVGIPTILFIIVVNLFVKKFNWDITIYCRISLSLMPILVLLMGAWIAKRIKKNC